jgi:hypothetical protein
VLVNIPVMLASRGAILAATVLAVRFAFRQPRDSSGLTGTGSTRLKGVAAVRTAPSDTDNDEFHRHRRSRAGSVDDEGA